MRYRAVAFARLTGYHYVVEILKLDYQKTKDYWDIVFSDAGECDPGVPLPFEELEKALAWLCDGSSSVLDIGCGRGTLLFRCLSLGVKSVEGLDISPEAITLAHNIAKKHKLESRCVFSSGDAALFAENRSEQFDALILSNIIDNIIPSDARRLCSAAAGLLNPGGKLMLKLNARRTASELAELGVQSLEEPDFYQENTGLFFWNLSDEAVEELFTGNFHIESRGDVDYRKYGVVNRLYLLRRK